MLRIFTYQDQPVLAGLIWGQSKPSGLLQRTPLAANDLALHWDDRTAVVPQEYEYFGVASLLSCLVDGLSEEDRVDHVIGNRVICAVADDPAVNNVDDPALFFAAVLVNGKPAIGTERLFDTRAELISHIEAECGSDQIDRLAIEPYLAEEISEDVGRRVPVCYFCPPTPSITGTGGATSPTPNAIRVTGKLAPQLSLTRLSLTRLPVWQIAAGAGGSLLALTAGFFILFPFQQSKPVIAPPIAVMQTTSRDEAAFGRNCLAAFAGAWPISPGWQLVSEGCATPAMRDPNLTGLADFTPAHAVAYRIYRLRGGFDHAIARKAAEAVMASRADTADRAIQMEIRSNRLFFSTKIAVPMLEVHTTADHSAARTPADLLAATEAVFLGLADSITLQIGTSGGARNGGTKVRVTLKAGFDEVLARVQRIDGAEIAMLNRNFETITLEITPRQIVTVPVARRSPAVTTAPVRISAKKPDLQKDKII